MPTTITEQIKILVELQKIDFEVHSLRKELAAHPDLQKKIEHQFELKKGSFKAAEDRFKAAQLQQKNKEGDLAQREDKIAKLQAQLYQLKSNKEYSAMELEIKGHKADKSLLEEDILRLLDVVEAEKVNLGKEKALLAEEEKKTKAELDALKQLANGLEAQIKELEQKRISYAPSIEPRLLSQYERILKGRDGLAIVPVTGRTCGGCNMELPPQVINETQLHDKWITCESCARLLYWPA